MVRKILFWAHLSVGVTLGVFTFVMAATGVLLSFQRQIVIFVDRDLRSVSVPGDAQPRAMNELLQTVRRAGLGDPTSITLRDEPQGSTQFAIGRNKAVYVDPYCGAVLGVSSNAAREFFSAVERLHRSLGAPLGSKTVGHWIAAMSNLMFGVLILLGAYLWLPRKWSWKAMRASVAFQARLRGRAREWNWHNVLGIWFAMPLLVIVLTGVIMSFDWANTLLFRLTGSAPVVHGHEDERYSSRADAESGSDPNYDYLFTVAKGLNPGWRAITLNVSHNATAPVSVIVDTGTGGQPQKRTQYFLTRETGVVVRTVRFTDGSLGQRLRSFVRFGHTGEYGGFLGQVVAGLASLASCLLVYTGLALAFRRFSARLRAKRTGQIR